MSNFRGHSARLLGLRAMESAARPLVGIIMGSKSDWETMANAAKALGLERSHLYKKCEHLGIDLRSVRKTE